MVMIAHYEAQFSLSRHRRNKLSKIIYMENFEKQSHLHLIVKLNMEKKSKLGFFGLSCPLMTNLNFFLLLMNRKLNRASLWHSNFLFHPLHSCWLLSLLETRLALTSTWPWVPLTHCTPCRAYVIISALPPSSPTWFHLGPRLSFFLGSTQHSLTYSFLGFLDFLDSLHSDIS